MALAVSALCCRSSLIVTIRLKSPKQTLAMDMSNVGLKYFERTDVTVAVFELTKELYFRT